MPRVTLWTPEESAFLQRAMHAAYTSDPLVRKRKSAISLQRHKRMRENPEYRADRVRRATNHKHAKKLEHASTVLTQVQEAPHTLTFE
jgi:hypothetical protein